MPHKILLIGPLPKEGEAKTYGGATILFKVLYEYLLENNVPLKLIVTNRYSGSVGRFLNIIVPYIKILIFASRSDVIFCNLSSNGAKYLAPYCFAISKIFGKHFVFRMFGSWIVDLLNRRSLNTVILKYVIKKSPIVIMESKYIIERCNHINPSIYWLPNSRKSGVSNSYGQNPNFERRFAFISQIKESKGVDLVIKAHEDLVKDGYTIDIFGPIAEEKYDFLNGSPVYKGALTSSEVLPILNTYDVLVLPTYYDGEGYPGIIIEAYSIGKPVIATNWKAIPEIVDDKRTGVLISPKNYLDFKNAIMHFTKENYNEYSMCSLNKYKEFDSSLIHSKLIDFINNSLK